jgi:hypothetical protein
MADWAHIGGHAGLADSLSCVPAGFAAREAAQLEPATEGDLRLCVGRWCNRWAHRERDNLWPSPRLSVEKHRHLASPGQGVRDGTPLLANDKHSNNRRG